MSKVPKNARVYSRSKVTLLTSQLEGLTAEQFIAKVSKCFRKDWEKAGPEFTPDTGTLFIDSCYNDGEGDGFTFILSRPMTEEEYEVSKQKAAATEAAKVERAKLADYWKEVNEEFNQQ